jgi:YVTN family beta-propeller protein
MFKKLFVLVLLVLSISALHAQTVAYVTNDGAGSVSVIDTATNTVTATIAVGNGPFGVVFSPDGTRAYVPNISDGTISVIDTAANAVLTTINVGGGPIFPAITPDGKSLYVPRFFSGTVVMVSTATNSVTATIAVGGIPGAVAITPDGAHAYVLNIGSVSVIDTATNTVVQSIVVNTAPLGFFPLSGIAITPGGSNVYVAGGSFGNVSVIATAGNTVVATIPLASAAGLGITPDGSRVYVSELTGGAVSVVDTATNTVEPSTIPVGSNPLGVAVTPDGAFVYVTNLTGNTVSVIATATNTVVATVTVGSQPSGIAIANLSTPFSQFSIKGLTINSNGFTEAGDLTLGANSSGLDLAHQPLTLTVDSFSLTIPPGSFRQVGGNMHFIFNGTINGLSVSMTLMANHGTSTGFKYSVTVTGANLTGQPNPATVGLKIGENSGTTTAAF